MAGQGLLENFFRYLFRINLIVKFKKLIQSLFSCKISNFKFISIRKRIAFTRKCSNSLPIFLGNFCGKFYNFFITFQENAWVLLWHMKTKLSFITVFGKKLKSHTSHHDTTKQKPKKNNNADNSEPVQSRFNVWLPSLNQLSNKFQRQQDKNTRNMQDS